MSHNLNLNELQGLILSGMNARQRSTTLDQRIKFLYSEVGELSRHALEMDGCYGPLAQSNAKSKTIAEIYDIMWNSLVLLHQLGVDDPAQGMTGLVDKNSNRSWPDDDLAKPGT